MNENNEVSQEISTPAVENVEIVENVENTESAEATETEKTTEDKDDVSEKTDAMTADVSFSKEDDSDDDSMAAALSHPMFVHFAKGKRGNLERICRDFSAMLAAGGVCASVTARMTPSATLATPDVALTETQRMIARAAGMSYREYQTVLAGIPTKK